jgi:tRNA nucleotidyltransferase/poly(A) polymerase
MLELQNYDIIILLRDIFERLGVRGYLVGGAVRDMLLGALPIDFDFVVEENERKHRYLAERLSRILGCPFKYNDHYHTAKFLIDENDVDIIMARDEVYKGIASRPRVWSSSLEKDLRRRDFTVNTMASPLNGEGAGGLIDPFSGAEDLREGILRILHNKSFHDDPTRIFRGIKYGARMNLSFESSTREVLQRALEDGVLDFLGIERIKQELVRILEEKNLNQGIGLLEEFNIMDYIINYDVKLNRDIEGGAARKLTNRMLFPSLFYKNDNEALLNIEKRMSLGKSFMDIAAKLKELEVRLNCEEEELYTFLFTNQSLFTDVFLKQVFGGYSKIQKYLKFKGSISPIDGNHKDFKKADSNFNVIKAKRLIELIGSELNEY